MKANSVLLAALVALCACASTNDTIAVPREQLVIDASADAEPDAATGNECPGPAAADDGVVALYTFDQDEGADTILDAVGGHDGSMQLGLVSTVDGPDGCDRAFSFGPDSAYFVLENSPAWDLEVGSVDLWLWLPEELTDHVGVFSRDASMRRKPGHISLFVDVEGRVQVRVQTQDDSDDNFGDAVSCGANPLPRRTWIHLGINFGPPAVELYVDGRLAEWNGAHVITDEWVCGQSADYGIAGNDLPWVVGRSSLNSDLNGDGEYENLQFPATNCAIDHLRISSERRDFSRIF